MVSGERLMVWDLNDYWLSIPEFSIALDYNHGDLKPFFPAQEEPEAKQPFIVYDNLTEISTRDWWMWKDTVMYEIYSYDLTTTAKLTNLFARYARVGAESARLVNQWASDAGRSDFTFKSMELLEIADVSPTHSEYGLRSRMVSLRVQYTSAYDVLV